MKTIGNPTPGDHEAAPDPKCWSCFDTGVRAADSEPCTACDFRRRRLLEATDGMLGDDPTCPRCKRGVLHLCQREGVSQ